MIVGFRSKLVVLCLGLSCTAMPSCKKHEAEKAEKGETVPNQNSLRQSIDGLKPVIESQDTKFASLRKQVESLPPDTPGFSEVRAKFYATEEGRGIMGVKLTWLSQRLDSALKTKNAVELEKVANAIQKTRDELREIDRLVLVYVHQLAQLQRMAGAQSKDSGAPQSFSRVLSTGYSISAPWDGVEQRLIEFIGDETKRIDQNLWFDFQPALGNGAELEGQSSEQQLTNLFEILKAYPRVKLRIGGFTDNTGSAAANKKDSTERAQALKKELVRRGVAASRLDAEGYGAERPLCPGNDNEECRMKNRRVAVQVTAK